LWRNAWSEFISFLDFDTETRKVICSTKCDRVVERPLPPRHPGARSLPTEAAALKCVYLAIMSLDPTGRGRRRWSKRWKEALNAFAITFADRMPGSETT
jgi:putative transposase